MEGKERKGEEEVRKERTGMEGTERKGKESKWMDGAGHKFGY